MSRGFGPASPPQFSNRKSQSTRRRAAVADTTLTRNANANGTRAGKVSYFTAMFPYIVLTVFMVKGLSLPGAAAGIEFYVKPDWEILFKLQVLRIDVVG